MCQWPGSHSMSRNRFIWPQCCHALSWQSNLLLSSINTINEYTWWAICCLKPSVEQSVSTDQITTEGIDSQLLDLSAMQWVPLWPRYNLKLDHDAGTPRGFSSDGRWGKEARKTSDADAQEDTSVHAFGNYHFENHAVLLKIQEHPDWLKYNKTDLTLLPNGSTDSFGMPWVPSPMDEPIEIGRFEPGHNHIGDVFDVSWMNTTNPLLYPGSPAPAPFEEIEISPQLSTPIGNASIVPWTFGSCPLIIPDQSFEGEHNSHAYDVLLRHPSCV